MNNQKMRRAVDDAVYWAVYWAVSGTVNEDSDHPALQDFLSGIGETL